MTEDLLNAVVLVLRAQARPAQDRPVQALLQLQEIHYPSVSSMTPSTALLSHYSKRNTTPVFGI